MLVTIDEYYDILFYNETLQALRNNGVTYKEYISVKPPYNWYIDIPQKPIMINYDEIPKGVEQFIVNKVKAARPNEEYLLQRRESNKGKKELEIYALNTPLKKAKKSDYACFFRARSKEQLISLSKDLGIIYYFGSYYNNKYKIALSLNKMIKNFIEIDDILTEKTKSVYQMETDLNYKIFRLNDRLRKFTETPYFLDGKYNPVKIQNFGVYL